MAITVKQIDNKFVKLMRQFQRLGGYFFRSRRADLFGATIQVIDDLRKKQLARLLEQGLSEEEITDDQLGVAVTWDVFCSYWQNHYSRRAFELIIPALVDSKLVRRYYVECHRRKSGEYEELKLVADESGNPYLYPSIDEARARRRDGGDVVNFFYLDASALNKLLDTIYGLRTPSQPLPPTPTPNKKGARPILSGDWNGERPEENHEREGYPGTPFSSETIPQPTQNCTGAFTPNTQKSHSSALSEHTFEGSGAQNCEGESCKTAWVPSQNCEGNPCKTANNKNNKNQEITIENLISAARAIDPFPFFQFDFIQPPSPKAILKLAHLLYPPLPEKYKNDADKQAAQQKEQKAAEALANMPLVQEIGLRRLCTVMAYHTDEFSGCRYRKHCRQNNPGVQMRLHQLESETVLYKMWQEMESVEWRPSYLPRATGLAETPPADQVEEQAEILDLAELAGIEPDQRRGMDATTSQVVEDWLKQQIEPYGYEVKHSRVGTGRVRGYAIEVRYTQEDGSKRGLRFYRFDDWDLIMDADEVAPMGSVEFVSHLSEAIKRSQVA